MNDQENQDLKSIKDDVGCLTFMVIPICVYCLIKLFKG